MKLLKKFKRKKKNFTNNFQMDPQTKFKWELLEENYELKKRLEELENESSNDCRKTL